ncbi:MAG: outer membrane protein assembly factor BamE [Parvibaculum sp.]
MKSLHSRPKRLLLTMMAAGLAGAPLMACAPLVEPVVQERGYVFDQKDLKKIEPGFTSKEETAKLLGSPSTMSTVDGEAWYYISSKFETRAFYAPKEVDRTVAAVYFDKTSTVQQVAYYGLEDGEIVNYVDRATPTRGKELTVLGQLFSNLGKFNSSSDTTSKPKPGAGH